MGRHVIQPPTDALSHQAQDLLRRGQADEARGEFTSALVHYDEAIARLRTFAPEADEPRRALGVALMNRGNALQKLAARSTDDDARTDALAGAITAYDEAIALLRTLSFETTPAYRNHLGAAYLNLGHTFLTANDPVSAVASFEQAIDVLRLLPLDENSAYRLNLAGAWTNLAHALLSDPVRAFPRAYASAQAALELLVAFDRTQPACAEMSLRARRALVMAIGELLVLAETARQSTEALATAASDAIDDGLALARDWETRGISHFRPLAARLFRLGAQLYRVHQPHFLAEFLLENLAPEAGAFATDAEFRAIASEAIDTALAAMQRPQLLVASDPGAEKLLATVRSLRAARQQLSTFPVPFSPSASFA